MTTEIEGRILEELSELRQKVANLEQEVEMLKFHSPGTVYGPIKQPTITSIAGKIVCKKCYVDFSTEKAVGFVCPNAECPTFLKAQ